MTQNEIDRIRQDATNASVSVEDNTGAMCVHVFALCDEVVRLRSLLEETIMPLKMWYPSLASPSLASLIEDAIK